MRRVFEALAAAVLVIGTTTYSQAATLVAETGQTFVRKDTVFAPVAGAIAVTSGAQVMVSPGGRALLQYGPDCTVKIGPGRVWTIAHRPPCANGRTFVDLSGTGRMNADLNPQIQYPGSLKDGPGPIAEEPRPWGLYVFGGATIGTGIYVITKDNDKKKPASP